MEETQFDGGAASVLPGQILGRCRIERQLGAGGMGTVFLAHHQALDIPVAVKVLAPALAMTDSWRERFRREARVAARLDHPNVVRVLDVEADDPSRCYLVMEYVEGRSLGDRLRDDGRLGWREAVLAVQQAAEALAAAHAIDLMHRDVKPDNLMATEDGRVKVADFGIARLVEGGAELTAAGTISGSPPFMSPEHLDGGATPRSDVWSLGVTLFALVRGESPYRRDTLFETIVAINETPLPPLPRGTPPALQAVVESMCSRDPDARPTMEAVSAQLEAVLDGQPGARRRRGTRVASRPATPASRLPLALAGVGLAVALVALAAVFGGSKPAPAGSGSAPGSTAQPPVSGAPFATLEATLEGLDDAGRRRLLTEYLTRDDLLAEDRRQAGAALTALEARARRREAERAWTAPLREAGARGNLDVALALAREAAAEPPDELQVAPADAGTLTRRAVLDSYAPWLDDQLTRIERAIGEGRLTEAADAIGALPRRAQLEALGLTSQGARRDALAQRLAAARPSQTASADEVAITLRPRALTRLADAPRSLVVDRRTGRGYVCDGTRVAFGNPLDGTSGEVARAACGALAIDAEGQLILAIGRRLCHWRPRAEPRVFYEHDEPILELLATQQSPRRLALRSARGTDVLVERDGGLRLAVRLPKVTSLAGSASLDAVFGGTADGRVLGARLDDRQVRQVAHDRASGAVTSMDYRANRLAVCWGNGRTLRVMRLDGTRRMDLIETLPVAPRGYALAVHPSGSLLVATSSLTMRTFSLVSRRLVSERSRDGAARDAPGIVRWGAGSTLYTAGADGRLLGWRASKPAEYVRSWADQGALTARTPPDAMAGCSGWVVMAHGAAVSAFDARARKVIRLGAVPTPVRHLALGPDRAFTAALTDEGVYQHAPPTRWRRVAALEPHSVARRRFTLAVGTADGAVEWFDAAGGVLKHRTGARVEVGGGALYVAWIDGRRLFVAGDGRAGVIDVRSRAFTPWAKAPPKVAGAAVYLADDVVLVAPDAVLAYSPEGTFRWRVKSPRARLALDRSRQLLAVGSGDRLVLWGRGDAVLGNYQVPGGLRGVVFSGSKLVFSSNAGPIRIIGPTPVSPVKK